jgi:hypothetical protein
MTKHAELIARLEGGETGRDLDAIIWYLIIERPEPGDKIDQDMINRWPDYTTSLVDAVALVEQRRAGDDIDLELRHGIGGFATDATIYGGAYSPDEGKSWKAWAPSPAAALICALLKAEGG